MNLYRAVSTLTGILILAALAFIAGGLVWWQSELTVIESEVNTLHAEALSK